MGERLYWMLFGTNVRMFRTLFLAIAAVHLLYFIVLPWALTRRSLRGPGLRRYLGFVAATPSLFGDILRAEARHQLLRLSQNEGLHDAAVAEGLAIVRHKGLPAAFLAEVRGRLADSLEAVGRGDEAREQRALAEGDLEADTDRGAEWYILQARQHAARRDHEGACRVLREGLESAAGERDEARATLMLQLAIDLFMAGHMDESARYAEEAAELFPDAARQYLAHRQAGASLGSSGRLDEAEPHRQRAVELASDDKQLADALADLAELSRKRGQLAEALAAIDRAEAEASVRPTRHTELIRYEILKAWGHFEEALAANRRAAGLDPLQIPRAERFSQGILAFGRAGLLVELGRLDGAEAELTSARESVAGDAKITLWVDALAARLAAARGEREAALAAIAHVDRRLAGFSGDRNTLSGVLGNLGRSTLALGEFERSLGYWGRYLDTKPNPVDLPTPLYHQAEAHRGLGEDDDARQLYREAIATGIPTHYARLAQARLRTLPI